MSLVPLARFETNRNLGSLAMKLDLIFPTHGMFSAPSCWAGPCCFVIHEGEVFAPSKFNCK